MFCLLWSYLAKISKQPQKLCSIHWLSHQYCCAAVSVASRWVLSSPNKELWVCSHASDCWLKKKERKTHSCIYMSLWKVPNYTGCQSTVPSAFSGHGNLNSAGLAMFKIQGKCSLCAEFTAYALNLSLAKILHLSATADHDLGNA